MPLLTNLCEYHNVVSFSNNIVKRPQNSRTVNSNAIGGFLSQFSQRSVLFEIFRLLVALEVIFTFHRNTYCRKNCPICEVLHKTTQFLSVELLVKAQTILVLRLSPVAGPVETLLVELNQP